MGYLHSRRVCLNLLAERCARVPVAVCMCWLYAGYSLGRGGSTLPAMWFSRLRIGTGSSAAARSARLRCISIGDVTCMMMRLGRTGYRAVPCARCYSEGDVQAAHTTPQAILRLQDHWFISNRFRGANAAYCNHLRVETGGCLRWLRCCHPQSGGEPATNGTATNFNVSTT